MLGIIPARRNSKRLPGKNAKPFAGKPLISHVIETALMSERLDEIAVSSDSEEILTIASDYNKLNLINRPGELALDESPAIDYVKHALEYFKKERQLEFDIITILQPSSPLTGREDIDGTIELLIASEADSAVSVVKIDHVVHPLKLKRMEGDRLLPFIEEEKGRMAYQDLPNVFVRNCSVYASRKYVIDYGEIIGKDCRGYIMPRERSVDINDEFDFEFAEFLYSKFVTSPGR